MNNDNIPTVSVSGLGKKYRIQHSSLRNTDLRETIYRSVTSRGTKNSFEEFWALRDVSFDVYKGDTLAIIGRNGAGKSTLLKMLARVIEPTTGNAKIRGRVASLLEVGTGFHPELTGKENIYFNGALLGMTRAEVTSKLDEIIEFSEVSKFIDTPIKRYSSGMKVRLAFSVASTLDADVMIIDEALSVGDVSFQRKSLERMKKATFEGKTVLFVTHSMGSALDLCNKALYLENGKTIALGETKEIVDMYLGQTRLDIKPKWTAPKSAKKSDEADLVSVEILNGKKRKNTVEFLQDEDVEVRFMVRLNKQNSSIAVGVNLFDDSNRKVFRSNHHSSGKKLSLGTNEYSIKIPTSFLIPGTYVVAIDIDGNDKWILAPNSTPARAGFILKPKTESVFEKAGRQGIINPDIDWK